MDWILGIVDFQTLYCYHLNTQANTALKFNNLLDL